MCLKKIGIRQHNTFAQTAALHGVKIPMKLPPEAKAEVKFDKEKEQQAEAVLRAALLQKAAEKQKELNGTE